VLRYAAPCGQLRLSILNFDYTTFFLDGNMQEKFLDLARQG